MVGREAPEHVFALLGRPDVASDPAFSAMRVQATGMLASYRARAWDEVDAAVAALRPHEAQYGLTTLLALYTDRIADHRSTPPPEDWDGVSQAREK